MADGTTEFDFQGLPLEEQRKLARTASLANQRDTDLALLSLLSGSERLKPAGEFLGRTGSEGQRELARTASETIQHGNTQKQMEETARRDQANEEIRRKQLERQLASDEQRNKIELARLGLERTRATKGEWHINTDPVTGQQTRVNLTTGERQPLAPVEGGATDEAATEAYIRKKFLSADDQKLLSGAERAHPQLGKLIDLVTARPNAFSAGAGLLSNVPKVGTRLQRSVAGLTDEDQQVRARVLSSAAEEIHRLAGSQQSAREQERIDAFAPAKTDSQEDVLFKLRAARAIAEENMEVIRGKLPARPGAPAAAPVGAPAPAPAAGPVASPVPNSGINTVLPDGSVWQKQANGKFKRIK